ncbi:hypothetical protein PR048_011318 [Dryococelus australis]|uniref:Chromo domain-containing protein n=1 Tax=Dryococelus australis TaxID=614101 RepID=A0ABQ9HL99_9NEOP|nr:hypothetical protein PR048_011318 [Dryococelus australis]
MSWAQIAEELHRPARRNYLCLKILIFGVKDLYRADIVGMIPYFLRLLLHLMSKYNRRVPQTIWMPPVDTQKDSYLLPKVFTNEKKLNWQKPRMKIVNYVCISHVRNNFVIFYTPNLSTEIYKVNSARHYGPRTYKLFDLNGNQIYGSSYEQEIMPTKFPDTYLVDKVLRRRVNQLYVKWLGFNSRHNSWVPSSALTNM